MSNQPQPGQVDELDHSTFFSPFNKDTCFELQCGGKNVQHGVVE